MELVNNEFFQLGVYAGQKQLMDHLQHQYEIGRPAEINGKLYWLKDAHQNLLDIMDDLDSEYGIQKANQYIVPMHKFINGECIKSKVIITANIPFEAYHTAYAIFGKDGWLVYLNYGEYEQLK